jgi:hypothetical protein
VPESDRWAEARAKLDALMEMWTDLPDASVEIPRPTLDLLMEAATAAALAAGPPEDESARVPDWLLELTRTWQYGCARDPNVAVTPVGLHAARMQASVHGGPVLRRIVGPWEMAPSEEQWREPDPVYLAGVCDVAGGIPIRTTMVAADQAPAPGARIGGLPCSWDGRHRHDYVVISRAEYEAADRA